jgi:ABC-type multidrug transport system permease subunit
MSAVIRRIGVVFALTFQEARRRRLLLVFLVGCVVFMGSGSACTYGCRKLADSGVNQQRSQIERQMIERGVSEEERAAKLQEMDELIEKDRESGEESLQSVLVALCFALIAFWIYLLAAFFTPFLALNDFFTGHHVLILSRPVKRWEYLFGKFAATAGMILLSLFLLLLCYLALMKFSAGVWGWELMRGLAYILQGITVFILMLMF